MKVNFYNWIVPVKIQNIKLCVYDIIYEYLWFWLHLMFLLYHRLFCYLLSLLMFVICFELYVDMINYNIVCSVVCCSLLLLIGLRLLTCWYHQTRQHPVMLAVVIFMRSLRLAFRKKWEKNCLAKVQQLSVCSTLYRYQLLHILVCKWICLSI